MPTYREESGLAMSSRNRYLSSVEKQQAATLYQMLSWAEAQLLGNNTDFREIEKLAIAQLEDKDFEVEYFTICQQDSLAPATKADKKLVILCASKFGEPRLIDNIIVNLTGVL